MVKLTSVIWRTDLGTDYSDSVQQMARNYFRLIRDTFYIAPMEARVLDKPNVHRLYEFAFHTIPMVGHAMITQELSLEKMHKALKRSVERSNHRDEHLFAMRNSTLEDWKSRLALLRLPIAANDATATRHATRLLCGHGPSGEFRGVITPAFVARMNSILMGPGFSPSEEISAPSNVAPLENSAREERLLATSIRTSAAYSHTSEHFESLPVEAQTHLNDNKMPTPDHIPNAPQFMNYLSLKFIPSWAGGNNLPHPFRIEQGTLIRFLCFDHTTMDNHFPFLRQTHRSLTHLQATSNVPGPGFMVWYVEAILLPHRDATISHALLLLHPVVGDSYNKFPYPDADGLPSAEGVPTRLVGTQQSQRFSSGRIVKVAKCACARIDRTIRRVGRFPVSYDDPLTFSPIQFEDGFLPRQG